MLYVTKPIPLSTSVTYEKYYLWEVSPLVRRAESPVNIEKSFKCGRMGKNGPWLPLKIWKKETSNDKVKLNLMDKAVKITAL